jgi:predicted AAA+ superfamily ATPase
MVPDAPATIARSPMFTTTPGPGTGITPASRASTVSAAIAGLGRLVTKPQQIGSIDVGRLVTKPQQIATKMDELIPRAATEQLKESVRDFRVVIVNGPRQAGKTTLLEMFLDEHGGTYRSLDEAEQLSAARSDPVSYVELGARPVIIDEVQRGGDALVLAIKRAVDRDRRPGQFVLSGSTRFLTVPTLSESLAGRAVFVDLWPFSVAERTGDAGDFLDQVFCGRHGIDGTRSPWTRDEYLTLIGAGSFPEALRASSPGSRRRWFNGYVRTVVARDIREFAEVQHAQALPQLLTLVAARAGSVFVSSDLARSLAVNHKTVGTYASYLETVFLVAMVPPWSTNLTSRVSKAPKAFITDSGLAAHLIRATPGGLREPGHPALGGLTETFIFTELLKLRAQTSDGFELYHYRDRDGREIDFICETPDGRIVAIEVKASASPSQHDARHLAWLRDKLGDRFTAGVVLHLGQHSLAYGDRITAHPASVLWNHATPTI